jgi:hypothetical protein
LNYQAVDQATLAGSRTIETSSSPGSHPPKPQLTLRVGIIGPALDAAPLSDECRGAVRAQFDAVFAAVDDALADINAKEPCYAEGAHKVRLVCGLVEEADGLAIKARRAGWEVDAILPFPVASCRKHIGELGLDHPAKIIKRFETAREHATTLIALPEDRPIIHDKATPDSRAKHAERLREKAYVRSREFLLGQVDIIVAVWDAEDGGGAGERRASCPSSDQSQDPGGVDLDRRGFRAGLPPDH